MSGAGTLSDSRAGTPIDRLTVRAGLAATVAVAVNVGLVLVAGALDLAPGFRPLTAPPVVFLTVVGVGGATLLYWILHRRSATPDRTFRRLAAAILVVSFVPDLGLLVGDEAATLVGVAALMAMHVVVAAVCVALIPGTE